jgi:hypothetical protein
VPNTGTAGTPLALTGTVEPANATNKTIAWAVISAGTTEAIITGNTLTAAGAGAVTVRASVAGGLTASAPYTQDFTVQIKAPGPGPDVEIPSYTRHSYETVKDITFTKSAGSLLLDNLPEYTNTQDGRNLQGAIRNKWIDLLAQMQVQGDNLKNGYNAVKGAYPDLTGINNIIGGENSIHGKIDNTSEIGAYLSGADADINAILNGIFGGNRAQFDKLLTAYQKGNYAGQKVRDEDGSKSDAEEAFQTALAETGLSFDELEPAMRDAINAAMGVDGIESAKHRNAIGGLNGDLINQIGDLEEARALADDFSGLNYVNILDAGQGATLSQIQKFTPNKYNEPGDAQTVQPVTKATHLT